MNLKKTSGKKEKEENRPRARECKAWDWQKGDGVVMG
jgi:hypothetical protein